MSGAATARTGASFARGKSDSSVETDPRLIRAVVARFGEIAFDLAADAANAQAMGYFGAGGRAEDALAEDWASNTADGLLWLNPPYDNIAPWARKCAETRLTPSQSIAFLVPASVGASWWMDHVHDKARVHFLNGRATFVGHTQPYPKDLALMLYGPEVSPGYEVWPWLAK